MTIIIVKIAASILVGFFAGPAAVYVFNHMPDKWLCEYGENSPVPVGKNISKEHAGSAEEGNIVNKRLKENPWRWVYSVGFICLCLRLSLLEYSGTFSSGGGFIDVPKEESFYSAQLAAAGLAACWLLLIIALSDMKYMIIPDQFVLLLALTSIGFAPLYKAQTANIIVSEGQSQSKNEFMQMLYDSGTGQIFGGMIIGGGFMLLCALAGKLILRQEAFGFGDVKLCGAIGLVLGINGTIISIAAAVIISGIVAAWGLATKRYNKYDKKPLGPYLAGSTMAYILVFTGQFTL